MSLHFLGVTGKDAGWQYVWSWVREIEYLVGVRGSNCLQLDLAFRVVNGSLTSLF